MTNAANRLQGHADLTKLIRLRAREIKPDGHLLLVLATSNASSTKLHLEALFTAVGKCFKDDIITEQQYHAFSGPWFFPTEKDLRQILSAVRDDWPLPAPWMYPVISHPAWAKLQRSEKTYRDYEVYAEDMVDFIMSVATDTLVRAWRCGVSNDLQVLSAEEEKFLEEFKSRYKETLLSEPLRSRRGEGSWLVARLVRRSEGQTLEIMARL
ncbi:hypothetical protein BU23DRAFT_155498 [Bimuria novae-zelandiae CBS 107.79]|uniref:Uncharacterized protein n=1 Tax=Bimuria novae-zelandiae CBS 107.79 TaxID=1447943 RepID=A0A6A5V5Z2_9PLEO|nr:hypothetical protein BU23DRAFT_155498 [Bimuria novae-zelandiae CBS 107.79]